MVHPYGTISVESHVLVTLVVKNSNYTKWALFFKSMCGKFSLKPHIDGSSLPSSTTDPFWPQWGQADCCVCSWILGFVDDSVLDLAMEGDEQMTHQLWTAIEGMFRANKEPCAIFLHQEFHSMMQSTPPSLSTARG